MEGKRQDRAGAMPQGKVSLFDLPAAFWTNLRVRSVDASLVEATSHLEDDGSLSSSEEEEEATATLETAKSGQEETGEVEESEREGTSQEGLTCLTCNIPQFQSVEEQHQHFKTDWHLFNLQRKRVQQEPVPFSLFQELTQCCGNASEEEEEENEDDENEGGGLRFKIKDEKEEEEVSSMKTNTTVLPKLFLTSEDHRVISFWRAILCDLPQKRMMQDREDVIKAVGRLHLGPKWTFLLCSGGYFAGAIYDRHRCLCHKTFRRYTVRKKQGGSQSSRDNKGGGQPKSAGASMRRYHEAQLQKEIREQLVAWQSHIDSSNLVFLFAPGPENKKIFFFADSPLGFKRGKSGNPKLRTIPFPIKRPSLQEIQRALSILSTVEISEVPERTLLSEKPNKLQSSLMLEKQPVSASRLPGGEALVGGKEEAEDPFFLLSSGQTKANKARKRTAKHQPKKRTTNPHAAFLLHTIQRDDMDGLQQFLQHNGAMTELSPPVAPEEEEGMTPLYLAVSLGRLQMVQWLLQHQQDLHDTCFHLTGLDLSVNAKVPGQSFRTALHRASLEGNTELVVLLLRHDANPTMRDLYEKTAYDLAPNRAVRNAFRQFAGEHRDKWEWDKANILPLTLEMVEKEKEKEKAKKKKKRQNAKKNKELRKQKELEEQLQKAAQEQAEAARLETERELHEIEQRRVKEIARIQAMSEREKRAYAAEQRMMKARVTMDGQEACILCGHAFGPNMVPFCRMDWKYC
ncbi:Ankyrin repeat and zinc finger domain-containing protein 1, partial [Balamuthia mandrillaris]